MLRWVSGWIDMPPGLGAIAFVVTNQYGMAAWDQATMVKLRTGLEALGAAQGPAEAPGLKAAGRSRLQARFST